MDFTYEYLQKEFDWLAFFKKCPNTGEAIYKAIQKIKKDAQNEVIEIIIKRHSNLMSEELLDKISRIYFQ
jgi:hypothetical protein